MTNNDFLKAIGMELKVARIRKRLTLKDISRITGMTETAICHLETGQKDGRILSYKRISEAIGIDITQLFLTLQSEERQENAKANG